MLIGDKCGAHTFPTVDVRNPSAQIEHEATTSRIGEDQLFHCCDPLSAYSWLH